MVVSHKYFRTQKKKTFPGIELTFSNKKILSQKPCWSSNILTFLILSFLSQKGHHHHQFGCFLPRQEMFKVLLVLNNVYFKGFLFIFNLIKKKNFYKEKTNKYLFREDNLRRNISLAIATSCQKIKPKLAQRNF